MECFVRLLLLFQAVQSLSLASDPLPSPVALVPSLYWDGEDGKWSSFQFQLGSPFQQVRLLPATSKSSIAPIINTGCSANDTACPDARGGLFNPNASTTWGPLGTFDYTQRYDQVARLGELANDSAGLDTVQLAWPGENGPSLNGQIVTMLVDDNDGLYYIGQFGLSPNSLNLSTVSNSYQSSVSWLRQKNMIPSTTWAYTAGFYNDNQSPVPGSLILGGYDPTRFRANNISFSMNADISKDLTVSIQHITSDKTPGDLLPNPINAFIDSEVPQIWLPVEACEAFEKAFNLTFTSRDYYGGGWYFIDDADHQRLQALNPSVTFTLGAALSGGPTVDITLPYAAFDLEMSPPTYPAGQRYFPLKRGANSTQYVLGRTFLQHAYVVADYDRRNFSVSQALFPQGAAPPPSSILAPGEANPADSIGSGLGGGAIAGIALGCVAAVALIVGVAFVLLRRRKAAARSDSAKPAPAYADLQYEAAQKSELPADSTRAEIDGYNVKSQPEMDGHSRLLGELDNTSELARAELGTEQQYTELDGLVGGRKEQSNGVYELA